MMLVQKPLQNYCFFCIQTLLPNKNRSMIRICDPKNMKQISIVVEIGQIGERNCDTCGSNRIVGQEFYFLSDLNYTKCKV